MSASEQFQAVLQRVARDHRLHFKTWGNDLVACDCDWRGKHSNDWAAHVAAEQMTALQTARATKKCSCGGRGFRSGGTYEYESPCSLCDGSGRVDAGPLWALSAIDIGQMRVEAWHSTTQSPYWLNAEYAESHRDLYPDAFPVYVVSDSREAGQP